MDKREFLKTSGAFLAGTMLSPLASGEQTAGAPIGQEITPTALTGCTSRKPSSKCSRW
jgi:anaerobic selenocysteine-containing dehydrogenase